jgi:hypothetical protein
LTEEKPRGLRVVYRPPTPPPAPPVVEVKKEVKKPATPQKKEFFEEKMHSFTPVYIPPKKAPVEARPATRSGTSGAAGTANANNRGANSNTNANSDKDKVKVIKRTKQSLEKVQQEKKMRPDISDYKLDSDVDEKEKKKVAVLPAVAPAVAAKAVKGKVKDVTQIRADEELKSYAMGIVGKITYTPQGKRKSIQDQLSLPDLLRSKRPSVLLGFKRLYCLRFSSKTEY